MNKFDKKNILYGDTLEFRRNEKLIFIFSRNLNFLKIQKNCQNNFRRKVL